MLVYTCDPDQLYPSAHCRPLCTSTAQSENGSCRWDSVITAKLLLCFREISPPNEGTHRGLLVSFPTCCTAKWSDINHKANGTTQFAQCCSEQDCAHSYAWPPGGRKDFQPQERTVLLLVNFVFCQNVVIGLNQIYNLITLNHLFFTWAALQKYQHVLLKPYKIYASHYTALLEKNKQCINWIWRCVAEGKHTFWVPFITWPLFPPLVSTVASISYKTFQKT